MVQVSQYTWLAGELAPELFGRSDLEKYDFALAKAENFFADIRGGLVSRPGTLAVGELNYDGQPVRLIPFNYGSDIANSYVIIFTNNRIYFAQDGGLVIEAAKSITSATEAFRLTIAAHGYAENDLVSIEGAHITCFNRIFEIYNVSPNAFSIRNLDQSLPLTIGLSAYPGGATARRVYSIANPYAAEDLPRLVFHQDQDRIIITHPEYAPRELIRTDHTNWSISRISFSPSLPSPGGLSATPSSTATAGVSWCVAAIGANGERSIESRRNIITNTVNYTLTAGHLTMEWTPVNTAVYYEVFRSQVYAANADAIYSNEVGFIGRAFGPQFTDTNLVPDFTKTPPQFFEPFAAGAIIEVRVSAGGSSYAKTDTLSVTDATGSGFSGFPVVNGSGEIISIFIRRSGSDYTSPTISVVTSTGSGATFTVELSPSEGIWPACVTTFQQRRLYAGSYSYPSTIYASRPGAEKDFSTTVIGADDDAYSLTIDDPAIAPIRHMLPMQAGLVVFTESAVWMLRSEGRAVVPSSAFIDPQTRFGAALLPPLPVDTDILYLQTGGTVVRSLAYDFIHRLVVGTNRSILSPHLFSETNQVVRWAYVPEPHSLVKAVRADGQLLTMSYSKEFDSFGWTRYRTKGYYRDVVTVREGTKEVTYYAVERWIDGRWQMWLEKEMPRPWAVDCGVARTFTYPAGTASFAVSGNNVTITTSIAHGAAVDDYFICGCARALVTNVVSTTVVEAEFIYPFQVENPYPAPSGEWTFVTPASTVSNLDYLEGETVAVVMDQNNYFETTVLNGEIALPTPAAEVVVGLPFTASAKILPNTVPQQMVAGMRKRPIKAFLRFKESLGFTCNGYDVPGVTNLMEERHEVFASGIAEVHISGGYTLDGQITFEQTAPLPFHLTQLVIEFDYGN